MEPLIGIQLFGHKPAYQPGSLLRCDVQIDAVDKHSLQAVETSVLWYTDGKGDEDLGVHYFERRLPSDADENDLRQLRSIVVALPNTPLSYEGQILQIRWSVRVRVFMKDGSKHSHESAFRLAVLEGETGVDKGRVAPGVLLGEGLVRGAAGRAKVKALDHDQKLRCEA